MEEKGQGEDVTPPTLTALSITPTTIDTSAGSAVVTVSLSATDDLTGVSFVQVNFVSPSGGQSRAAFASTPPATSVNVTADAIFPQFSEVGTWTVSSVFLFDAIGTLRVYDTPELAQLGFPTELEVVGQ